MKLIHNILTQNDCYKKADPLTPRGLMIHSVGTAQPNAEVFLSRWNKPGTNACVHALIDGLSDRVFQTLPWNIRGWHCGGSGNNTYIGVEMCEPSGIHYTGKGAEFTVTNKEEALEVIGRTYYTAVELFAKLCLEFRFDPMEGNTILDHSTGNALGIASNHADVMHLWHSEKLGTNYSLDSFRRDVAAMMGDSPKPLYKVQVGAFRNREYAERLRDDLRAAGYSDAYIVSVMT